MVEPTGRREAPPDDRLRDTHHRAARPSDGFRKSSTHPTAQPVLPIHNVKQRRYRVSLILEVPARSAGLEEMLQSGAIEIDLADFEMF